MEGESEGRETEKHFVPRKGVNLMKPLEEKKKKTSREPIQIALSNPICHFQYKVYVIFINRKEKTEL